MIAAALTFLRSPIGKGLGVAALAVLALLYARHTGYADCRRDFALRAAQERAEWAEKVSAAAAAAYKEGAQAALSEAMNKETVDEIEKKAAEEPGADRQCLSDAAVERLRSLE